MVFFEEGDETKVSYDLRETRAKLITKHLIFIEEASRNGDYIHWLKNLKLLFKTIEHFVSKKVDKFNETYYNLLKELINKVNENEETLKVYLGKSKNPIAMNDIETCLDKLEMHLYRGMEESGLWGTKRSYEGL